MTDEFEKLMSMTPATVPAARYGDLGLKAIAADRLHCFKCDILLLQLSLLLLSATPLML